MNPARIIRNALRLRKAIRERERDKMIRSLRTMRRMAHSSLERAWFDRSIGILEYQQRDQQ